MMSTNKYRIRLTTEEQTTTQRSGIPCRRTAAYKQTHAHILLMSDESRPGRRNEGLRHIQCARCGTVNGRAGASTLCGGGHRSRRSTAKSNFVAVRKGWMVRVKPTS